MLAHLKRKKERIIINIIINIIIINIFRYISYIILAWPTFWAVLLLSVPAKYHFITIILSRDLFVNMKQQKYSFVILPESPLCTF